MIFFQGLPGGDWASQPVHAGVGTLCRVNLNESQETWQENKFLSLPFLEGTIRGRVAPHSCAQATGCMILRSCGPHKDVPLGVGFPPLLFHFSFSFTFAAWALHSVLVRVCCFSLCPWTGSAVAGWDSWAGQIILVSLHLSIW